MASTLPFRADPVVDDAVKSTNGDRLRLVPGDENWVVRFISPIQYAAAGPPLLTRTRSAHDELAQFGIGLPPRTYLEVEEQPGSGRTVLVIAARIWGGSLVSAVADSDDARWAAEAAVTDLLRYYAHKFVSHETFIPDIHIRQFMWGTHLHNPNPAGWMVDLDLGASALARDPDALQIALLHWWIGETASSAVEVERRSGRPVLQYRQLLDELATGPVFAHPSAAGRVARMREALDAGETFDANEAWVQPLFD